MNIKTTVRFHLTQVRKAKILGFLFVFFLKAGKKSNKCWYECGEGNCYSPLVEGHSCATTMEIKVDILQNARNDPEHSPRRYMLIHVHFCSLHNS